MNDESTFQFGNFVAPLTAATTHSLLQDADPALYQALAFYAAVLSIHLGARFDAEVTKAGLSQHAGKITALAIPCDPVPLLQEAQLAPPLLALFPVGEQPSQRTRGHYQSAAELRFLWVMPPLSAAQYIQLDPLRRAVAKVVMDRTSLGYDPSYQSGTLFCAAGGVTQLELGRVRYGTIQGGLTTTLWFPTVEFELTVYERRETTPNLQTLAGTDGAIAVTDAGGANPITIITTEDDLP